MVFIILLTLGIATLAFLYFISLFIGEYFAARKAAPQQSKLTSLHYAATTGIQRATREITSVLILGDD